MTKLTDLNGGMKELINLKDIEKIVVDYDISIQEGFLLSKNVYEEIKNITESLRLEVDVEAMAKEIKIGITDIDDFEKLMANGKVRKWLMDCANHLSTTIPKWARLVRK